MKGRVQKVFRDRAFGWIIGEDKISYFVHQGDAGMYFPALEAGDAVTFTPVSPEPPRGPRAARVAPIDETNDDAATVHSVAPVEEAL